MSLNQFINTLSIIRRNPYVNFYKATTKHILWNFRKIFNYFPCVLEVENFFIIIIKNRDVANGCGGLINSMGLYDPNNMSLIYNLSKNGIVGCMFDVGANIGIYSLIPDESVQVYAFEPHPFTFGLLEENIKINKRGNIHPMEYALDATTSTVSFINAPGSTVNKIIRKNDQIKDVITVKSIKGDDFCNQKNVKPDLLKIDTEGNEKQVLLGFKNTLKFIKILLVESDDLKAITPILKGNDFIGPYKYNHVNRTFSPQYDNHEDWIFLNSRIVSSLEGYKIVY